MTAACPACGEALQTGLREWHRVCAGCGYEGSTLAPHILEQADGGDLDEAARAQGLAQLRNANFQRLLDWMCRSLPLPGGRPRLLDVGCAHGWFIERAAAQFETVGIEPDSAVANATRARGLAVRGGFFPDALNADERFDVIVFNDVLEHIPDVNAVLAACWQHLQPGGWVIVNAPSRRGFLYRLSKVLARLGRGGAFERMWQLGFPSPHVHYFDTANLRLLAHKAGFSVDGRTRLASMTVHGLYARIRYSREVPAFKALVLTLALGAMAPLLAVLPADIEVWSLRRPP
ncbi:MAG: methyltransferase domain-containing protein [Xanthomonadaceae bacterium]|nr:methyltransferase domain-containing protein [Xanthomonadaceae bacterium]